MWQVAPESTNQQVLGSPTPTLPTKPSSVLLRWCVTGLSVLDVPVAPMAPPASDPVTTVPEDLTIMAFWSPSSCSCSGSSASSASSGSSPSTSRSFPPFPRPLALPLPLAAGLAFAFGPAAAFDAGAPLGGGFFEGSFCQQSFARWPLFPQ